MADFRIVNAAEVDEALDFPSLIDALTAAFADPPLTPPRHVHAIPQESSASNTLLLMPAWQTPRAGQSAHLGVKLVTVAPENGARGLDAVQASYLIQDARTGVAKAMIDGHRLTLWRTAAASALAARHLAREDASTLAMLGAGGLAPFLIEAHRAVRRITTVRIWNRTMARAEQLAHAVRASGLDATACATVEEAMTGAHIVSAATLATEPLITAPALEPGMHIDLVGAFTPAMRECDSATVAHSSVYVDTPVALSEAGDLVLAERAGLFQASACKGTLTELVTGAAAGRSASSEITLFKSVGAALEDLAAAELILKKLS